MIPRLETPSENPAELSHVEMLPDWFSPAKVCTSGQKVAPSEETSVTPPETIVTASAGVATRTNAREQEQNQSLATDGPSQRLDPYTLPWTILKRTQNLGVPRGKSTLHTARYKRFLARLVAARKQSGLTQEQAVSHLRKTQTWLSKSERGERRVDPVELEDLANLYGVELDFFRTKKRPKRLREQEMSLTEFRDELASQTKRAGKNLPTTEFELRRRLSEAEKKAEKKPTTSKARKRPPA